MHNKRKEIKEDKMSNERTKRNREYPLPLSQKYF